MRKSVKGLLTGLLVASSLTLPVGTAYAQEIKARDVKFAFVNVKEHPHSLAATRFAELVAQKSGGKLKVRTFPGGTLGADPAVVSALQGGTIEMTALVTGILAGQIKEFSIFDLPFLFDSVAEADAVADGPVGKKLLEKLPEKGLIGLGFWDHGFRNATNSRRPITKVEDIQGLKIRVLQIPIYTEMFNTLGANSVPLAFTELYTALDTKTVDGQENPWTSFEASKLYEVQKYGTTTRHVYNVLVVLVSKKFWDQLSNDERKIFTDAASETTSYQRKISREMDGKSLELIKSKGMSIIDLPQAERAKMREKLKPVTDKYSKEFGEALVSEVNAEIGKVRSKGGK
jgi:TRAP-type transport system periplasmic protein